MHILCDTCSILMLIRIVPDMFIDERFDCLTITDVKDEIFRTQKFKTKYPWRIHLKNKIETIGITNLKTDEYKLYEDAINRLIENGTIN